PAEDKEAGVREPPAEETKGASATDAKTEDSAKASQGAAPVTAAKPAEPTSAADQGRLPVPLWFWIVLGISVAFVAVLYRLWNWERLEVFKMLLSSFFPLALLILAVLGSIVFGLATPSEAAAVGGFGGFLLAGIYRFIAHWREAPAGGPSPGAVTWKT